MAGSKRRYDPTCSVEGCDRCHYRHGFCEMHDRRWRRTGSTDDPMRADPVERFWARVDRSGDCWLWTGPTTLTGYGMARLDTATAGQAHRIAYELEVGPIPADMQLDHLCRRPSCVNPAHLEPVTRAENMRRARAYR